MSLSDVIKTALDQIKYIAKTETVIGEPIHAGGVTLIPVSRVSIGFAAAETAMVKTGLEQAQAAESILLLLHLFPLLTTKSRFMQLIKMIRL
jgi:uncharacterized spore protein YtfJ